MMFPSSSAAAKVMPGRASGRCSTSAPPTSPPPAMTSAPAPSALSGPPTRPAPGWLASRAAFPARRGRPVGGRAQPGTPRSGGASPGVPGATAALYRAEVRLLEAALVAWRLGEGTGRVSSNNGVAARCGCGRRIRVAASVLEAGPITCGLCGSDFEPVGP
jgi:hypothetical protein